ncbi:hypothetical protein DPMN_166201 [Dreissena polymorpha]|uniref:Uncharacterized protein n=1 Tax=Dreissena polymorpha TaxID=45954 RepID=A0A9D4EYE7_DREPO|nr:hypothetical protein DPMN_166201 [Dreissena polymorpha]
MRAIVSNWKFDKIMSYAFILGIVHHSTTYELKERPDCEWYCKKEQQWDGLCPVYGSCRWYCQAKRKDCTPGTRYHCARDLHNKDLFNETCAPDIICLAGEEPQISLQQSGKAFVYCRPCYRQNMYNGRHNTSSAVFSECPSIKTNLCLKTEHKVDCDKTSYLELTKTDGYCRCDARNGYAAQSEEMCFYQNKRCFKKKCPEGNVLSLNCTCVKECPVGFARSDESDICNKLKSPHPEIASVFTTVTTLVEDKDTNLSTEKPPNESRPNKRIFEVVVTGSSLLIAAFIVLFFVKQLKVRAKSSHDIPTAESDSEGLLGQVGLRI